MQVGRTKQREKQRTIVNMTLVPSTLNGVHCAKAGSNVTLSYAMHAALMIKDTTVAAANNRNDILRPLGRYIGRTIA